MSLGNLLVERDWGFARDYVSAMQLIVSQRNCENYVIGTGTATRLVDVLDYVFSYFELDWEKHVVTDDLNYRPDNEVKLVADNSKITKLGWNPTLNINQMLDYLINAKIKDKYCE